MENLGESIRRAMHTSRLGQPKPGPFVPTAGHIMATRLITCTADQPVREVIALMLNHRISGLPVVDEDRQLVGMVSEADCLRVLTSSAFHQYGYPSEVPVSQLMTKEMHTIEADVKLPDVAQRFLAGRLKRLPVLTDGRLVGQVSRRDVLTAMVKMEGWDRDPAK